MKYIHTFLVLVVEVVVVALSLSSCVSVGEVFAGAAEQEPPDRPELPGHHQGGRVQDRHHARIHTQEGKDRSRVQIGHAHLRSGTRPAICTVCMYVHTS